MNFRDSLRRRAASLGGSIVLVEGWDERVRSAASVLSDLGLSITLLERDCSGHAATPEVARLLLDRKPDKVGDIERGLKLAADPLYWGVGLVALGEASAAVAGATLPTADVVRAALLAVGAARGITTVSSAFYMCMSAAAGGVDWWGYESGAILTFTDAGVVPDPTAVQLADIAAAAIRDRRRIVGDGARVAFLSYSTKGSAGGDSVERVREAVARFRELEPNVPVDGELQADAALIPRIAVRKNAAPDVGGEANVLVFPNLDAGNIAYKLVERLAGAIAIGPILQGLARPVADLSRGASVDDIVDVSLVALLQSAANGNKRG
ncbi:MAG: phosphate acyltransferase [Gemmatimonadales bacterium]